MMMNENREVVAARGSVRVRCLQRFEGAPCLGTDDHSTIITDVIPDV